MKAGIVAAIAALAVTGCGLAGPSDHQVLVNSCVAEGENEAVCSCIADAYEENLTPELFRKTAQAVGREGKNTMSFIAELTLEEQMSFASVLNDMFACSLTGETAE